MDAPDRKRLKSTYKAQDLPPLPPGWTEHTAPTGTFSKSHQHQLQAL
jgi:hypothetical protein